MPGSWEEIRNIEMIRARLKYSVLDIAGDATTGILISGVLSGVVRYVIHFSAYPSAEVDPGTSTAVGRIVKLDASGTAFSLRTFRVSQGLSGSARLERFEWKNKKIVQPIFILHAGESVMIPTQIVVGDPNVTYEATYWDN